MRLGNVKWIKILKIGLRVAILIKGFNLDFLFGEEFILTFWSYKKNSLDQEKFMYNNFISINTCVEVKH